MNQTPLGPVMLDIEGLQLSDRETQLIQNTQVGGLILFTRNFDSKSQLVTLVNEIRDARPNILIAVDHEGGRVQRFRDGFTHIPPMARLGELYSVEPERGLSYARELGWLMASELIDIDIDISFAPVLDIDDGISAVIGDRSFSSDPHVLSVLAKAFMEGMHDAGMATTGKHFPGHGAVAADSHVAIPIDERSKDDVFARDLKVFADLAQDGMDAVMPAHVIYPSVSPEPAGFSKTWIQQILRQELHFDGVVFSDDLTMEGASVAGSFLDRAKAALQAGCDMILVCNNSEAAEQIVLEADLSDYSDVSRTRINKMRKRIVENRSTLIGSVRWQNAQEIVKNINNKV
ncbi:beta-N-acetylhexosaminidase [Oleiphilus sp. HI0009]|uniref:beta-N-acetylhexosaminidase n=1 Tax=unclassified Oleiphilus TaxID=2631174 RepID=UPI0007C4049C|nr:MULTISPECIES: beta-N-acetylhexosaminidase [unclassified Oleiphilus]KZX75215.1 beta-N-acetylhexosaminidase [Oleiphilus sp. HI0009]KZY67015.1 beta-N-acetylhexosaminidase [Oleiphilus sp. HI0067]KZY72337.1 beta-N-acetylhexosaminidase [Oleiphilus sp. HI0066]